MGIIMMMIIRGESLSRLLCLPQCGCAEAIAALSQKQRSKKQQRRRRRFRTLTRELPAMVVEKVEVKKMDQIIMKIYTVPKPVKA